MPLVWILTDGSDKQQKTYKSAVEIYNELLLVLGKEVALVCEEELLQRASAESGLGLYIGDRALEIPKLVFLRIKPDSVNPCFTLPLIQHLERMGVHVINNSAAISLATNKALTYQELCKNGKES